MEQRRGDAEERVSAGDQRRRVVLKWVCRERKESMRPRIVTKGASIGRVVISGRTAVDTHPKHFYGSARPSLTAFVRRARKKDAGEVEIRWLP